MARLAARHAVCESLVAFISLHRFKPLSPIGIDVRRTEEESGLGFRLIGMMKLASDSSWLKHIGPGLIEPW